MSYDATIINNYPTPVTIIPLTDGIPGTASILNTKESLSLSQIMNDDGFTVRLDASITIKFESTDLTKSPSVIYPNGENDYPTYSFKGPGVYTIYSDGEFISRGAVSASDVVNAILTTPCEWVPYSNTMFNGPWDNLYGINSQCEFDLVQTICGMLNTLFFNKSKEERLYILNTPIITQYLPPFASDGTGLCTMLEAAVIMRYTAIVIKLLTYGANPNVTSNPYEVTILSQLIQEQYNGTFYEDPYDNQAIIDALLKAGAWVPPYFPGTQGYFNSEYAIPDIPIDGVIYED